MSSAFSGFSGLSGRYAAALFELAEEHRQLDEVADDTVTISAILAESPDLLRLLVRPVIARDDQARAAMAVFKTAGVSALVLNFTGIVAQNHRLYALADMCNAFQALLARRRGEITATVTTAHPLGDKQSAALEQELKLAMGSKITLDLKTDAALLGGMVIRVGSRMIDSSLRTKIQRLELSLKGAA
ncbi:MAG: F0F1 ATP synthase subunit delta [Pseudomonadota bacterium]|nr:F0F1 ATP synthase subunit delta [Pseudomonadota bacterium]